MPEGLLPRMAIEWGFLILLAVGAAIADLRPLVIILVMLAGWVLVMLVELLAARAGHRTVVSESVSEPAVERRPPPLQEPVPPSYNFEYAQPGVRVAEPPVEAAPPAPAEEAPRAATAEPEQEEERAAEETAVVLPDPEAIAAAPPAADEAPFSLPADAEEQRPALDPTDPYAPAPERARLREADQRIVHRLEPLKPRPKRGWFRRRARG
jgi:hypothetical protein